MPDEPIPAAPAPCHDSFTWPVALTPGSLGPRDVHVYAIPTHDLRREDTTTLSAWLSPAELAAAQRLRFPGGTEKAIVSYGALRKLLGAYLHHSPASFQIVRTPYGKPYLLRGKEVSELKFNLSHSGELTLIAFSLVAEVGVDVERIRPDFSIESVSSMALAPEEQRWLNELSEGDRVIQFYRLWTRKEAVLKAAGVGLSVRPSHVDVSQIERAGVLLRDTGASPAAGDLQRDWFVKDLWPVSGYAAAIAIAARDINVVGWTFPLN